ncbi:hypothetical protein MATR_30290 [Marivirga tractuosa]|uniref:Outer membrane protein beta-barrel domain-containing protein n=1 Tax=Marivirga tractuosa (strain ATCC 23168 / DSM 4126 / NBRC 15989 / NCIMB 1408 / VKM B-1430 / H-43) TaxID=643867 RepID=E4TUM9_MARTH|nr:outer membrane beta-barrel protein [Marivirga tractuosa]ADR23122.1 hypothetical protein Ftrac_3147 [Marivirga tractuosa DSM 4126]BDD16204.1 hypothetical protein MATR_30290 [Marivirga tractuosa]
MKALTKAFFITFLLILSYSSSNAQILLGAKSGARYNWMNYEDFASEDYEKSPFFGWSAGITAAYKVKKRFLIQLDIMYSQSGKNVTGITDPVLSNHAKYHFLNTPIVYKVDFLQAIGGKTFKWYIGAGPNVNFWLGGNGRLSTVELLETSIDELEYRVIFEKIPASPEFEGLYINEYNKVQVGLIASAGIVLEPAPGQSLMIDFRYEWGHSNMSSSEGTFASVIAYRDNLNASIQGIQVSVAYVFDIINKGKKEKKLYYENK